MWNNLYNQKELNIWLDLSTYCNAACPQCHRTDVRTANKIDWLPLIQWSYDEFKKAFPPSSMRKINQFQICGTWGDPMMNNDIYEIAEYIVNESDCKMIFNTNGSMRNSIWWWQFGHLVKDRASVYFCVDGIDQEMHERYRQKTNLDIVLENMEAYSEFSKARALTIVFEHNENYLKQIYELSMQHGATDHIFIPTDRVHHQENFTYYTPQGDKQVLRHSSKYGRSEFRTLLKAEDL